MANPDPDIVPGTWLRSNGAYVFIVDMNDYHLLNALRKCERDTNEVEATRFHVIPVYKELFEEAKRRGLITDADFGRVIETQPRKEE